MAEESLEVKRSNLDMLVGEVRTAVADQTADCLRNMSEFLRQVEQYNRSVYVRDMEKLGHVDIQDIVRLGQKHLSCVDAPPEHVSDFEDTIEELREIHPDEFTKSQMDEIRIHFGQSHRRLLCQCSRCEYDIGWSLIRSSLEAGPAHP